MTEKPDEQCVASHGDFMRNLVPGSALIAVARPARPVGKPHRSNSLRTEEQAQTHCPKDMVVGSTRRAGSITSRVKGHMVARMQAATLSYRSRRRGHAQDAELTRSGCCFSRQ